MWPPTRVVGIVSFLAFGAVLALFTPSGWGGEDAAERPLPSAEIAPPAEGLRVGERLNFHGRWYGIPVGTGWIEVKEIVELDGRRAYHIEAQGHTNDVLSTLYPIHDVIHSHIDVETLQPLRFEKHQREGRYRADEIVTFNYATGMAHYRSLLNDSEKDIAIPPDVQDLISALYWFRLQPLQAQQTKSLQLYTDEKIYQTDVQVKSIVSLELLKRGTFSCFVIEPKPRFKGLLVKRGRIWAYLTADDRRLPLLVKATTPWGAMSAVLEEESLQAPESTRQDPPDASGHPTSP